MAESEQPVEQTTEPATEPATEQVMEQVMEQAEQTVDQAEKTVEQAGKTVEQAEKTVEQPAEQMVDQAEKAVEQPVEQTVEQAGKAVEQPAEQTVEKPTKQSQPEGEDSQQNSKEKGKPDTTPAPAPAPDHSHVFAQEWSRLPKDVLVDKIKGVIYGQAIGDAFGLSTEFMTRKMAQKVYGKSGPSSYAEIAQDFHRMRWNPGDWTDDTDQMLLILQMIVEKDGRVDKLDFAKRLHHWMQHGFQELEDVGGMGIGMTVHRTLCHNLFLKDPHAAASQVWESSGRYLAANGAIMRTSILGILNFNDVNKVVANTKEISQCTHADPRCTASCIAVTTAIALMLQGAFDPTQSDQLASLINFVLLHADKVLLHENQRKEIRDHIKASSLEKLKLDDEKTIGYTFKALGAGFYGLRHAKDFRKTITDVIMQAGDADSNGAVCGALMGCKLGFQALPQDLLKFPYREWLDTQVERFLRTIGLD